MQGNSRVVRPDGRNATTRSPRWSFQTFHESGDRLERPQALRVRRRQAVHAGRVVRWCRSLPEQLVRFREFEADAAHPFAETSRLQLVQDTAKLIQARSGAR